MHRVFVSNFHDTLTVITKCNIRETEAQVAYKAHQEMLEHLVQSETWDQRVNKAQEGNQ